MSRRCPKAFSLTEVLMAAGILAIGFMLIAMIYPVGIKLTASATEKTIGIEAANEAQSKLKLYAEIPNTPNSLDFTKFRIDPISTIYKEVMLFEDVINGDVTNLLAGSVFFTEYHNIFLGVFNEDVVRERFYEMLYPSADYCDADDYDPDLNILNYRTDVDQASYRWTVLCAATGNLNEIDPLILATRRINRNAKFPVAQWDYTDLNYGYVDTGLEQTPDKYPYPHPGDWPMPVRVDLIYRGQRIWDIYTNDHPAEKRYINEGDIVIDSIYTGNIIEYFKVIDKDSNGIELDGQFYRPGVTFTPDVTIVTVWVVPPAVGSSRSPLVGIYRYAPITFK